MRTVSRCSPNFLETSRMLLPSTITARRTRRYTSTLYIHRTIHGSAEAYEWRRTVQFATAVCQRLPARTGQFTSAAYTKQGRHNLCEAAVAFMEQVRSQGGNAVIEFSSMIITEVYPQTAIAFHGTAVVVEHLMVIVPGSNPAVSICRKSWGRRASTSCPLTGP